MNEAKVTWRNRVGRLANRLSSPIEKILRASELAQEAIPVGLMTSGDIDAAVTMAYTEAPDFYNPDVYTIDYEQQLIEPLKKAVGGRRLLDLYCGQGREARIFAQGGFNVTGVDGLASSVEGSRRFAERSGFAADFLHANIDFWEPEAQWDVVYTSLWMYSTVPDRVTRLRWLERLRQWLAPGGVLVISTTPLQSETAARRRQRVAAATARLTFNPRRPEYGDRFYRGLFWHDFSLAALQSELTEARFDIAWSFEQPPPTPCNFYCLTTVE